MTGREPPARTSSTPSLDILLVGGTGFMGGLVCEALAEAGHRVTVLSRGRRKPPRRASALEADRNGEASLAEALSGNRFDLTVDFLAFDRADVEHLLLVPRAALGRYVMISSGQVYLVSQGASPPHREEDADGPLVPEPPAGTPDHAEWRYGVGKRGAEQALFALRATHGVRGVALRLPIVQGAGDATLRLWAWIERMLDGGPLLVPDGGARLVRHVWAGDVSRAIVRLAAHDPPERAVYNLAQPDAIPFRDWLRYLATLLKVDPVLVDMPWEALHAAGLEGSCAPYAGRWASEPDPARAREEWGFETTSLQDYLPGVVRWHLEHRPSASHAGYAQRAREVELASARIKSGAPGAENPGRGPSARGRA